MSKLKFIEGEIVYANEKAPLYLRARAKKGECFTTLSSLGDGRWGIISSTGEEFVVQSSHFYSSKEVEIEAEIDPVVKQFILENEEKVASLVAETIDRRVVIALAREIGRVPSPKVCKLMLEMLEMNPEVGHLSLVDLYSRAEDMYSRIL